MPLHRSKGFTLVEVIISIFIIGVVLVLSNAVFGTIRNTRDQIDENIALRIAAGELDRIRNNGYDAAVSTDPLTNDTLAELPSGAASSTIRAYNDKTKEVSVGVSWLTGTGMKYVKLTTLLTSTGGL